MVRSERGGATEAAPDAGSRTRSTGRLTAQLVWYTLIGIASTLAYVGLYALLRDVLGAQGPLERRGVGAHRRLRHLQPTVG